MDALSFWKACSGRASRVSLNLPQRARTYFRPVLEGKATNLRPSSLPVFDLICRPVAYAVAFVGCSIFSASVVDHYMTNRTVNPSVLSLAFWKQNANTAFEEFRRLALPCQRDNRGPWKGFYAELCRMVNTMTNEDRTICSLMCINLVVFVGWKLPFARQFMRSRFTHEVFTARCSTMFSAAFSHNGMGHLAMNMYGLWLIGRSVHRDLGREQFLAFCASSAVCATLFSHLVYARLGINVISLGFSGVLMALLSMFALERRDEKISLLFGQVDVAGIWLLPLTLLSDFVLYISGVRSISYLTHLGGVLFGALYYSWGTHLWSQRHHLTQHLPRGRFGSAGT